MNFLPLLPVDNEHPPFAYWDDGFSREELDILQRISLNADLTGLVGSLSIINDKGAQDDQKRRSKISWLRKNSENLWVYNKLSIIISTLNSKFYRFDISGYAEDIQMTNYESTNHGTYGWHADGCTGGGGNIRKMSVVMQLTEPGEYEGGELQVLHDNENPITIEKRRGRVVIFPSYKIHRVTPVTKGTRQSLVCWLTGAPLR